jgi:hypothetical protein
LAIDEREHLEELDEDATVMPMPGSGVRLHHDDLDRTERIRTSEETLAFDAHADSPNEL